MTKLIYVVKYSTNGILSSCKVVAKNEQNAKDKTLKEFGKDIVILSCNLAETLIS